MGKLKDLIFDIQEDVLRGHLSFAEIAAKHDVPFSWVDEAAKELAEMDAYIQDNDYFDSAAHLDYLE